MPPRPGIRSQSNPRDLIARWLLPVALMVVTVVAYAPCLHGGFVWDDRVWTTDLPGLWDMWSKATALQQYYPLTGTSCWIDNHLWGDWTLPRHLENVLLHALNAVLLWRVLQRLAVPGAWLAAFIFALHPTMVESAAWITERKNVLSLALTLSALLAWPSVTPHASRLRWWLCLMLFVAALLAKITAIALPPALLLIAWWKNGTLRWRTDVRPALPFFVAALAFGVLISWIERHHVGATGEDFPFSMSERIVTAGRAWWFYPWKLVWPVDLSFIYPDWRTAPSNAWHWLAPISAIATCAGLAFSRWRGIAAGIGCYTFAVLPVLGLVDTYAAVYAPVWDHWAYVPSVPLIALGSAALCIAMQRLPRMARMAAAAVMLAALAGQTWRHCHDFRDMETLWRSTLARNPDAWLAHNNLGTLLPAADALPHYQRCAELRPGYAQAWHNVGSALVSLGKPQEAIAPLDKALALEPLFAEAWITSGIAHLQINEPDKAREHLLRALEIDPAAARAESALGLALQQLGQKEEALQHAQRAIALAPPFADAHNNLGIVLQGAGRFAEALAAHAEALRLQPDMPQARQNLGLVHYTLGYNALMKGDATAALEHLQHAATFRPEDAATHGALGLALVQSGRAREAIASFEAALKLKPELQSALNNLAWILAAAPDDSLRNGPRAVELATRALANDSANASTLKTLAAALAETGRFDDALQTARRARELAASAPQLQQVLDDCIRRIESHQPIRDDSIH